MLGGDAHPLPRISYISTRNESNGWARPLPSSVDAPNESKLAILMLEFYAARVVADIAQLKGPLSRDHRALEETR
jgi:hypothetical protein